MDSMRPCKLKRHLEIVHPKHVNDTVEMFERRAKLYQANTLGSHGFQSLEKKKRQGSYAVSLLIAQEKKPHTAGEKIAKGASVKLASTLPILPIFCGEEAARKIDQVHLSNNTVKRRIDEMSMDVEEQVVQDLKDSMHPFSLQLDVSTEEGSCSQLMAFVRYLKGTTMKEEFLFCSPLKTTNRSEDIFGVVDDYFNKNNLEWRQLGSICTDGAPVMVGKRSGFVTLVKEKCPDVTFTHCILHRHALAVKFPPASLQKVMDAVIETVSYIPSRSLQHCLFQQLYEEMDSEHTRLVYHSEVRWLSRGQVFKRVLEFLDEMKTFFQEKGHHLVKYFGDPMFTVRLTYLNDIFTYLNDLNTSLQGNKVSVVEAAQGINTMKALLRSWCTSGLENNSYSSFENWMQ